MVFGNVRNSVIFSGVTIEENANIESCIIMSNSTIKHGSTLTAQLLRKTTIGSGVNSA